MCTVVSTVMGTGTRESTKEGKPPRGKDRGRPGGLPGGGGVPAASSFAQTCEVIPGIRVASVAAKSRKHPAYRAGSLSLNVTSEGEDMAECRAETSDRAGRGGGRASPGHLGPALLSRLAAAR